MLWRRPVSLLAACLLLAVAPHRAQAKEDWVRTWDAALQLIPQGKDLPAIFQAPEVSGRTVRQIIYPSLGGQEVRLHISNRYGTAPLDILEARIAKAKGDSAETRDAGVTVTFNGSSILHLPPGGEADSDPVTLALEGGEPYATSLYVGPHQRMEAWHRVSGQINYISAAGNHAGEASGEAYRTHFIHYAWVTSLSVKQSDDAKAILAIGDSITDGLRSSTDLNRRWPDGLMRRLAAEKGQRMAVLNAGISGNRLLSDSACWGEKLVTRFDREITSAADIKTAIVLIGINDINFAAQPANAGLDCDSPHTQVSAADLIAGYRQLAVLAHHRQIRIIMGTILPAGLPPAREKIRLAVNDWIRSSSEIDGVIDFDKALRDPSHPESLRAAFDCGDHVHPSDAGYAAMAQAVPLQLLAPLQLSGTATTSQ
ncbi:MAG TPA: SGNH/GDSL hydrolase family protein [Terriglobales bacterium]|nr:SGNH/GDSL hydrolase family protein [Terriglobales bacterium]